MKKALFFPVLLLLSSACLAQLKPKPKCDDFTVDLLDGHINRVQPDFNIERIKLALPCFTSTEAEGGTSKCGGGVFFKDKDVYFYTQRDYILIGEKFKGKLSIPAMGAKRGSLFKYLGHPKMKDDKWDAYQTNYGTLVLYYNTASKVNKIIFSRLGTEQLNICE